MNRSLLGTLRLACAAVASIVLAIYLIPAPKSAPMLAGRKTVYFWHMWTGEWKTVVDDICNRFNKSQTEYQVVPVSIPADGADTKFILAECGGNPPDVVSTWLPVLGLWSSNHLIRPVEDVMTPADKALVQKEAFPIYLKAGSYQGKLMAIVPAMDDYALYYRTDYLKEVGVSPNHLPTTLEGVLALGRKLDRFSKSHQLTRIGFLPQNFEMYVPGFGGSFGKDNAITIGSKPQLDALQMIQNQIQHYGASNITKFLASQAADSGPTAPLIQGNYGIMLDGEWRVQQIRKYAPNLPYTVGLLPPPKGGIPFSSYANANFLMIPGRAKHPRGAWAFMKFWTGLSNTDEGAKTDVNMSWLPFSKSVAASAIYQKFLTDNPNFKPFVNLLSSPNLVIPPQGVLEGYFSDQLTKTNQVVNTGQLTAAEALQRMKNQVALEQWRQKELDGK